jgi:hypothetical protein
MRQTLTTLLCASAFSLTCHPMVQAQVRPTTNYSRNFNASQIEARQGKFPTLLVWPGAGLTVNLSGLTNEYVKQIWLDDPSKLTLDYAGNLCIVLPCTGGVKVLHLKRITGLQFQNLPSTSLTTLTVVTISPQGERIYKFILTYGKGKPQYMVANLLPTVASKPPNLTRVALTDKKTSRGIPPAPERIALYEKGLILARQELGTTTRNRLVLTRFALFLEDIKAGYGEEEARGRNNLSQSTLDSILQLGTQSEAVNTDDRL